MRHVMAFETIVLGFGGVVFLILLYAALIYNRFINLRVRIDRSWAQIDVFLKRRYDLIPNLVETVKGYAKYVRDLLLELTKMRSGLISDSTSERARAESKTALQLKTLFAVSEKYPELKANQNFLKLQEELVATENSISFIRISYNDAVSEFNIALKTFPSSIIAGFLGFKSRDFFQATEVERESVEVKL